MAGLQPDQPASLRVMIVDANADAADSAAMLLRLWGYDVRTAYTAAQAISEARTQRPDVLLTGILLPGCDGYALSKQMREVVGPHRLACVAVTGLGWEKDRQRSAAEAFAHHLVKPVDPSQLKDILQELDAIRPQLQPQEVSRNRNGTRGLLTTASNPRAARSWLAHDVALPNRVRTMSVAFKLRSQELRVKSHALRQRSGRHYLGSTESVRLGEQTAERMKEAPV